MKRKGWRGKWEKASTATIVACYGPECPRCGHAMEVREHDRITPKLLLQPFYYSRWYCCKMKECKTWQVMPEEFKVWNPKPSSEPPPALRPGDDVVMDILNAGGRL